MARDRRDLQVERRERERWSQLGIPDVLNRYQHSGDRFADEKSVSRTVTQSSRAAKVMLALMIVVGSAVRPAHAQTKSSATRSTSDRVAPLQVQSVTAAVFELLSVGCNHTRSREWTARRSANYPEPSLHHINECHGEPGAVPGSHDSSCHSRSRLSRSRQSRAPNGRECSDAPLQRARTVYGPDR